MTKLKYMNVNQMCALQFELMSLNIAKMLWGYQLCGHYDVAMSG